MSTTTQIDGEYFQLFNYGAGETTHNLSMINLIDNAVIVLTVVGYDYSPWFRFACASCHPGVTYNHSPHLSERSIASLSSTPLSYSHYRQR